MSADVKSKLAELEASLEQVTKQHNEALAFANQKKEQALTLNGAIIAYKELVEAEVEEVVEEETGEDDPQ